MLQFLETKTERKRVRYENEESTSPGREDPSLEESVDVPEDPLIKTEDIDDYLTDSSPDHGLDLSLQRSVIEKKPEIDEDEMFLLSLLPSIRKLTPLQKMDFKLEVMGSLRRIQFSNSVH
ncbi:unnamed protein product [Tenebrio molitor]|nr:unnamed protein product [Tenebrio molitor]